MTTDGSARPATVLRVLRSASVIPREQWDALARRGYHRHAWFVAAESCGAEPRHIGVFDKRKTLVALIPAYIERGTPHGDLYARWYGATHRIADALGSGLRPSLAIGAPMSTGSDLLGSDEVLTEAVLENAFALLEEEARDERLKTIVWPLVDESAETIREVAKRCGFRESFANAEAVIDVEWSSPEEYIISRPKNVQRTLRNELAWVHDQGIRVSWERDLGGLASTFDAFYRASFVARNRRVTTLPPQFFSELAAQQSPGVRVQCAWKGATLLEMAVALDGGGALDLGLSAHSDESRSGLLYQHCLCYDPIRAAIADSLTRIHLGPDALNAKIVRGARLQSRLTLVRGLTRASRAALSVLAPITNVRNRARQRRVARTLSAPG